MTQPLPAKRRVILVGSHLKMWHLSSKETGQALNETPPAERWVILAGSYLKMGHIGSKGVHTEVLN